ncbi:hypothetical protein ACFL1B_00560 [Nanoarchaeota archaeon]
MVCIYLEKCLHQLGEVPPEDGTIEGYPESCDKVCELAEGQCTMYDLIDVLAEVRDKLDAIGDKLARTNEKVQSDLERMAQNRDFIEVLKLELRTRGYGLFGMKDSAES